MGREDRERKRDLRREKSEVGVAAHEAKGLSLYICWFRFSLPKFLHFFIAPKILTFCRPHVEALCLVHYYYQDSTGLYGLFGTRDIYCEVETDFLAL